ncbi:MAG TPA: arginine deiminase-related protein [Sphingomicrobium sp.]
MEHEAQTSGTVLMVRPAAFGFHAEAAASNAFARSSGGLSTATAEFDRVAERLTSAGIEVLLLPDTPDPPKPDAVFPNNWVSFHGDGTMVLYPMATAARRLERNVDGLKAVLSEAGFEISRTIDLSPHEAEGRFLEGTGSLVMDRRRRVSFASHSIRTDESVVAEFDQALGYETFVFDAHDRRGQPIYHTNVLLSFGSGFAVLCDDVVPQEQRHGLIERIEATGRSIIHVTYEQLRSFACNLIELKGPSGPVIALSSTALRSFSPAQRRALESFGDLLDADIPTIEQVGGGSVRCMIGDVHLPRR